LDPDGEGDDVTTVEPATVTGDILLEVRRATKSYRGVVAVDGADLTLHAGRIHGLIGPNGAGKTTLLNLISGHASPDRGTVVFRGRDITKWRTDKRARLGLVRTFQDCRLLEDLSVAENLWLSTELVRRVTVTVGTSESEADVAHELLSALGLEDRLDVAVRDLSSGERKAVEVGRALSAGARLLLLDEPFSGLTRTEVDQVLLALRHLRASNCSVLLVEHNLGAVFSVCDEVTAMDKAAVVAVGSAAEVRDAPRVRQAFFGADVDDPPAEIQVADRADSASPDRDGDAPLLAVRDVRGGYGRTRIVHGVDFEVAPGETIGIVGANGAGKTTLFRTIMGLASVHGGQVVIEGRILRRLRPAAAVAAGLGLCPQGRNLFPSLTVEENLRLGARRGASRAATDERIDGLFDVLPVLAPFRRKLAGALSGGQQQLLAIGRALTAEPRVLLLDEPSTGLSVGAIRVVEEALQSLSAQGLAIVLAEQNLGFALAVCDHGYVMESGSFVASGSQEVLERAWELTVADGGTTAGPGTAGAGGAGDGVLVGPSAMPGTVPDGREGKR
jgi:ABC-type branched-subunit amino acid transport system ATPase component